VWARGITVSDPTHVTAAARLREQTWQPRVIDDQMTRDLTDYDRAFGLDGEVA
jgi:hypothetical protein